MAQFEIQSFYYFRPLQDANLEELKRELTEAAEAHSVLGLIILGCEGINTTLCGTGSSLLQFVGHIKLRLDIPALNIKSSFADKPPFKRFNVKIRSEIVTLDRPDIIPTHNKKHLSPEAWDKMLADPDSILVDTRNIYETKIGKFKNAVDLEIDEFTEFPEKMNSEKWDKDKKYMIYCTGGIRCEKAIYTMEELGYKNVYQLDGGVLNYLKRNPDGAFEGECFVFDSRVSVDKNLAPSQKYSLCPHCGDVADLDIRCLKCDHIAKICKPCQKKIAITPELETCSKNCAYHYKRDPQSKSPQQQRHFHGKNNP